MLVGVLVLALPLLAWRFALGVTAPTITAVNPTSGPVSGGQYATITGNNFDGFGTAPVASTSFVANGSIAGSSVLGVSAVVNGTIYIYDGTSIQSAPVTNPTSWTVSTNTLPSTASRASFAQIGSKLYLFGGYGKNTIMTANASDPTSWTLSSSTLPGIVAESQLAIVGSKIYLFGGTTSIGGGCANVGETLSNAIYSASLSDPTTWTSAGTLPTTLCGAALFSDGNNLYLVGGDSSTSSSSTVATNTIYKASRSNPASWTDTGKTLPASIARASFITVGNTAYIYGGINTSGSPQTSIFSASVSDLTTWTSAGTLPAAAQAMPNAIEANGQVYIFGYYGSSGNQNTIMQAPLTTKGNNYYNPFWQSADAAPASISFGGSTATDVQYVNATTMTAYTPTHAAGTVDVVGSDGAQSTTLSSSYTYLAAPTITNVSPKGGPTTAGQAVTITGSNFGNTNGSTANAWTNTGKTLPASTFFSQVATIGSSIYAFGGMTGTGTAATNAIYSASTSSPSTWTSTGKTLPASIGEASLAVIGNTMYLFGGYTGSTAVNTIYTANTSNPTSWTNTGKTLPASIYSAQLAIVGNTIYLFGGAGSNAIYSAPVNDPTSWTTLSATLPATVSQASLAITNGTIYLFGGYIGGTPGNAIYSAPVSDPTSWTNTGATLPTTLAAAQIIAVGNNLYLMGGKTSGSASTSVSTIYTASVSNPTSWTNTGATLSGALEASQAFIAGSAIYLVGGYNSSAITNAIYSAPLTATGTNLYNPSWITTQTSPSISFGGTPALTTQYVSATTMLATAPAHAVGAVDVTETNTDGQTATLSNGYTYLLPPTASSLSPSKEALAGGDTITVTGTNFVSGDTVTVNGASVANVNVVSDTTLTFTAPSEAQTGSYPVVVTDPVGQKTSPLTLAYFGPAPTVSDIAPNSGSMAGGDTVTITGSNFTSGDTVTIGSQSATNVVLLDDTHISFTTPASSVAGPVNVFVTDTFGQSSSALSFTYALPATTITSISPATGPMAGGQTVSLTGSGFLAPNSTTNSWTTSSNSYPIPVAGASLAVVGPTIYMYGGNNNGASNAIYSASINDPTTWTNTGKTLPAGLYNASLTIIGHTMYLFGGTSSGTTYVNTIYTADTSNPLSWTLAGTLPAAVGISQLAIVGNNIYLFGGYNGTSGLANIFTASTSDPLSWTDTGKTLPVPLQQSQLAVIGNTLYLFGGIAGSSTSAAAPDIYTASTSDPLTWTTSGKTLPAALWGSRLINIGDQLYLLGGAVGASSYTNAIYQANTSDPLTWSTSSKTLPGAYRSGTVAVIGNAMYYYGGYNNTLQSTTFTAPVTHTFPNQYNPSWSTDWYTDPSGSYAYSLQFDGVSATNVAATSSTTLTATTPAHAPDLVDVSLTAPDNSPTVLTSAYAYVPDAYAFTGSPFTAMANQPSSFTIEMRDASGNPVTSSQDITLNLSSSSGGGSFALSANGPWDVTSVTVPAGQSSLTLYYRDAIPESTPTLTITGPAGVTSSQKETITTKYKLLVTGVTDPVNGGTPSSVTVQAIDWQGIAAEDYTGTIHFTSSDSLAYLPADTTITAGMHGRTTLTNGVTMITTGEQTVTATDTSDANITGTQSAITVQNGYAGDAAKLAIITDPQNAPSNTPTNAITVQVQDVNGNPSPLPVPLTVYVTSSSATGKFSADGTTGWTSSQPFAVTIPANASSTNVFYQDSADGTKTLTFADETGGTDTNLTDTTQDVRIGAGPASQLSLSANSAMTYGSWHAITVSLKDSNGLDANNTTGAPLPVYLTTDSTTTLLSTSSTGTDAGSTLAPTIASGGNKVTFYIKDAAIESMHLTASDASPADGNSGLSDTTAAISFYAQSATKMTLTPAQSSVAPDTPLAITISLFNDSGQAAVVDSDTTLSLNDASAGGSFSLDSTNWTNTSSVNVPAGTHSVTVYYKSTHAGSVVLHATGLGDAQASITVLTAAYTRLGMSGSGAPQVNLATSYTVTAFDIYGNAVAMSTDTPVYLYSSTGSGAFATASGGPWSATSVTIPAGSSSATFYYKDTSLGASGTLTTSDQTPLDNPDVNITNGTQSITIAGDDMASIAFTTGQQTITAGSSSGIITVQARNADGTPSIQGSDLTVSLSSDSAGNWGFTATNDPNGVSITTVTIPQGQSSASFYYHDTKAGTHNLSAMAGSYSSIQSITITADTVSRLKITTPVQTNQANQPSSQFRVQLTDQYGNIGSRGSDTFVSFSSNCEDGSFSLSSTPWTSVTSTTIPAGQTSAYFYFMTSMPSCTISVDGSGVSGDTQSYYTVGGPVSLSFSTAPTQLEADQTGSYTVTLNDVDGNAINALSTVTLYLSTDLGTLNASTVTIPAGSSSASFTLNSSTTGTAHITARDQSQTSPDTGLTDASASTTIVAGAPAKVALTPGTANGVVGQSKAFTVSLENAHGSPTTSDTSTTVSLGSDNTTGIFTASSDTSGTPITSVTIPAGSSTATLYYHQTTTGTNALTASSTGLSDGTASITVSASAPYRLMFVGSTPSTAEAGETVTYTIEAQDTFGNIVTMPTGYSVFIDTTGDGLIGASGDTYSNQTHALTAVKDTTRLIFTYRQTTVGNVTLTAADTYPIDNPDTGTLNATTPLAISYGTPGMLVITPGSSTIERGGVSNLMTLTLENGYGVAMPAPSDTTVQLSSSPNSGRFATTNSGPWTLTSLTIPAGAKTGSFYFSDTTTTGAHTISAHSGALTNGTAIITVDSGAPVSLAFTTAAQTLIASHTSDAITVEALNAFGYPTTMLANTTLSLSSTLVDGEFASPPPTWGLHSISWPKGAGTRTVYFRGYTAGIYDLTAAMSGLQSATQSVTIVPQTIDHLLVTNISTPQNTNNPSSVVVVAQDADNYTYSNYTGTIHFTSSDPLGTVPADYTFKPQQDYGLHTFTNGVLFCTAGTHTVTAIDSNGITGSQTNIVVKAANSSTGTNCELTVTSAPTPPTEPTGPTPPVTNPGPTTGTVSGSPSTAPKAPTDTGTTTPSPATSPPAISPTKPKRTGIAGLAGSALHAAKQVLAQNTKSVFKAPATPYAVPVIIYGFLLFLALILARDMYREIKHAHILIAALKREQQTAEGKTNLINLVSHYLRTPITIINGGIELVASMGQAAKVEPLKNTASELLTIADSIIDETAAKIADIPEPPTKPKTYQRLYTAPLFWMPIGIGVVLIELCNFLTNTVGNQHPSWHLYAVQLLAGAIVAALLYSILRNRTLRKQERRQLQADMRYRAELDEAKNSVMLEVADKLDAITDELQTEELSLHDVLPTMLRPLHNGIESLSSLVTNMRRATSLQTTRLNAADADSTVLISSAVTPYIETAQQKHITITANDDDVVLHQDSTLLQDALRTLVDNAVAFSKEGGTVTVKASQQGNDTAFTITNEGQPIPEAVVEHPDQPFNHQENVMNGTHQGIGLSLYIDSLIAQHLGGRLTLANDHGTSVATITVPTAAPEQ